jgi:hypothetical protein
VKEFKYGYHVSQLTCNKFGASEVIKKGCVFGDAL